jgi:hypothetical protein
MPKSLSFDVVSKLYAPGGGDRRPEQVHASGAAIRAKGSPGRTFDLSP